MLSNGNVLLHQDIAFAPEIILKYAQRSITVEFSALHYWQPSMNIYAYKLEGFDTQWNYVSGTKNFAVYSNLSPGTYKLIVRGTNNYGIWSENEATLQVRGKSPIIFEHGFPHLVQPYCHWRDYYGPSVLFNETSLEK